MKKPFHVLDFVLFGFWAVWMFGFLQFMGPSDGGTHTAWLAFRVYTWAVLIGILVNCVVDKRRKLLAIRIPLAIAVFFFL